MIDKRTFQKGNFKAKTSKVSEHPAYLFLIKDKNHAYKVDEIAKAIKFNKSTVRCALRKLQHKKLVLHKAPYFIAI